MRNLILALALTVSAPAFAGGSMSTEVRVIHHKTSRPILLKNAAEARERLAKAQAKLVQRDMVRAERQVEKEKVLADKIYAKKLKCQKSICTQ